MNYIDFPEELTKLASQLKKSSRVINVANQKGGVGKSTIVRVLPTMLSMLGFKCLVIDLDMQANATKSFFITRNNLHEDEITIFEKTLMKGIAEGSLDKLIIDITDNLHFIPSAMDLESFPTFLSKRFGLVDESDSDYYKVKEKQYSYFQSLIDQVKNNYDFVFFDTPPSASDFTKASSYVSDYVLIAFQTQSDSLDGAVDYLSNTLTKLNQNMNTHFEVLGVLPNQFSNKKIDMTTINDAIEIFGEANVFQNILPNITEIQNIPRDGLINDTYWNSRMYKMLIPVVQEFLTRIYIAEEE
ncbi:MULTISPECIES: ParA family protein [Vagococcus]|uniref:ParA family protein n=1 Tax=Vagococcus TaxID=2737 RepID=UPI000E4E0D50|nr:MULTISPECIES: AAA family ATPase [Vagococcus]RHH67533.1 ATPase [Vagococcus sp. AM17-17]